jgi:hypothetical protein
MIPNDSRATPTPLKLLVVVLIFLSPPDVNLAVTSLSIG